MIVNSRVDVKSPFKVDKRLGDISRAINGNIEFGVSSMISPSNPGGVVNIKGAWRTIVTPGVADTEFTLTHNLGQIPNGILVVSVDKAAIVYASRKTSWTGTQMFLKCNVASVTLTGFVI